MTAIEEGGALQPSVTGRESYTLGEGVACSDGPCGHLRSLVIDPVQRSVSHLVVHERSEGHTGRMVPVGLVESTTGGVLLHCSRAEFGDLPEAQERDFLVDDVGSWPAAATLAGLEPFHWIQTTGVSGWGGPRTLTGLTPVVRDEIPPGETELRRGDPVHASDGHLGEVSGLLLDTDDRHVSHVLVRSGLLSGRQHAAVPIGHVTTLDSEVVIDLTRDAIRHLPPVTFDPLP
jgi:sporulation protein YlmC with PRC-barrel domain